MKKNSKLTKLTSKKMRSAEEPPGVLLRSSSSCVGASHAARGVARQAQKGINRPSAAVCEGLRGARAG